MGPVWGHSGVCLHTGHPQAPLPIMGTVNYKLLDFSLSALRLKKMEAILSFSWLFIVC